MKWSLTATLVKCVVPPVVIGGVLLLVPAASAVCPSGLPNEVFCDDYDCYCLGNSCPTKCPETAPPPDKANTPMRQVWVTTSRNTNNNSIQGSEFNLEDTLQVFSEPFGNGLPCQQGTQIGHITVTINDNIQATFGSQYEAVRGTDANPLVMSMNLQNQAPSTSLREHAQNVYYELSLDDDFAPTDYVSRQQECADCGVVITQDWGRILCSQSVQIPGCPEIATAPIHASIAFGYVAYLDPDPCDCGQTLHGSKNSHLSFFDGKHWHILTDGLFPGSGDFRVYGDLAAMTMTIKTNEVVVEYTSYNETAPPLTVKEYSIATIPRQYLGPFDKLHAGMGIGCRIDASSWSTCIPQEDPLIPFQRRPLRGSPAAGRPSNDDFVLYGGEGHELPPPLGSCCQTDGQCTQTTEASCQALGATYQGDDVPCGTVLCCPTPYADADADGDIDVDDFGAFQRCFDPADVPSGCECFDRDLTGFPDGVINQADFDHFIACATGANVPFVAADHLDCHP